MDEQRRVRCRENQGLADFVLQRKREHADKPKGLSENLERTFVKAYRNVCDAKDPITTLKDLSQIKGFGKWMLKLMKEYFHIGAATSEKNAKGRKRYIPQRNSAAYALLITLHRGTPNAKDFMRKQELIDAADASGLSHVPIAPEKGKGKAGLGHSKREYYSGWSCMTTLRQNLLVVTSSNPAKYKLTDEGREVANECITRSGLSNSPDTLSSDEMDLAQPYADPKSNADSATPSRAQTCQVDILSDDEMDLSQPYADPKSKADSAGPSRAQTCQVDILSDDEMDLAQLYADPKSKADSAGPYRVQNCQVDILSNDEMDLAQPYADPKSKADSAGTSRAQTGQVDLEGSRAKKFRSCNDGYTLNLAPRLPPLKFGETFEEAYQVIMILDDREHFTTKGNKVDNIRSRFKIKIEVRRLPVGDCVWIARHKYLGTEYVLDLIVERKNIDDLRSSIRDNRYRDQKHRLQRSGFKKLIYLIEGDPNHSDAAESIKTAGFTTEIMDGFDVLRTNGLGETLRTYGYLTKSIHQYYKSRVKDDDQSNVSASCPCFDSFVERCQDLDKMTISDLFAIQLMQVPQVTEEIAIAVLDMYPTLLSLASAYSHLEGNVSAQEEMLRNRSNDVICAAASKNIFKLVWGE